jgi:hypothetical protein
LPHNNIFTFPFPIHYNSLTIPNYIFATQYHIHISVSHTLQFSHNSPLYIFHTVSYSQSLTIPHYLFATQYHIHFHSSHNNTVHFLLLMFTYVYLRSILA